MTSKQVYKEQLKLKGGWDLEECKEKGGREEWKEKVDQEKKKERVHMRRNKKMLYIYIYISDVNSAFNTN